nr:hypothetical protein [Tanacetum cinerariifolium]
MIPEPGDTNHEVSVNETFHVQTDDELTEKELKQIEADDQAIQTILLSLPEDIYVAIDSCETDQKIWLRVQQMMKGSDIGIREKKAKLFNEWERFTSNYGESIASYYHHFLKLMNDLKRNKHFPEKIASNLKFLNNLQPEWSRHVTIVHQTKYLHTADYTQLYDFLKYNQKEVNELKAKRLAKTQDPLALMRISSNPRNRQIAQPGMNMGQDRKIQMVGGNGENQFRQYAGQNVGNLNGYNAVQNVRNQVAQNTIQIPRVQNVGNQNGLIGVPGNANQNGNGNLVAVRAEGNAAGHNGNQIRCYNCGGVGHFAKNCTVRPRRRDAAYLQTQLLIAQKEEIVIQLQAIEFDLMAAAADFDEIEEYTELLEPIPESQQVPQNDNDVISEVTSVEQSGGTVEQHPVNVEETHALYDSLYHNLAVEVEKVNTVNRKLKETNAELTTELAKFKNQEKCFEFSQEKYDKLERCYQKSVYQEQCLSKKINALHLSFGKQIITLNKEISDLNKQLSKEKSTVSFLLEEKKRLKSNFKTREDELLDKQIQLEKKIKDMNNILVKTGQSIQTIHMLLPKPESFYHTEQKMALGYQNPFYLKQAQKKQQSLYDGKVLLEKHDPPAVHDSGETLQLAQERIDNTKTRRPQPRSNTKNDRVPSASKSSCNKNKRVKVEEHHRNLLLSKNKKHISSACNNVKLATQNVKSKVVCAMFRLVYTIQQSEVKSSTFRGKAGHTSLSSSIYHMDRDLFLAITGQFSSWGIESQLNAQVGPFDPLGGKRVSWYGRTQKEERRVHHQSRLFDLKSKI